MTKADMFKSFLYFFAVFLAASSGAIIVYDKSMDIVNDEYNFSSTVYASSGEKIQLFIDSPTEGSVLKNPVKFYGTASGTWFFEGSFPVRILDSRGDILGTGIAQAKGDWMTTSLVPFEGIVTFSLKDKNETRGFIVFEEDDPSGLQKGRSFKMPIIFK